MGMHRRAELEGNLRRKPNPKGAQAGARKRSEESDEAIVAEKRAMTVGIPERQRVAKRCPSRGAKGLCV